MVKNWLAHLFDEIKIELSGKKLRFYKKSWSYDHYASFGFNVEK